jgi:hypothetical protein
LDGREAMIGEHIIEEERERFSIESSTVEASEILDYFLKVEQSGIAAPIPLDELVDDLLSYLDEGGSR